MKRIIPVFLSLILVFACFAHPVSASENDVLFNVLDLGPSNNGTNYAEAVNRTLPITYELPFKVNYNYIDVVFTASDSNFTVASTLTVVRLGSNLYRAYGHSSGNKTATVRFTLNYSSNATNSRRLEILSFYIALGSKSFVHTGLLGQLHATVGAESSSHNMTSPDNSFTFELLPTVEGAPNQTTGTIYVNDWSGYDYIDFSLNLYLAQLSFINCYIGDTAVKYDVSYLTNEDIISDSVYGIEGYTNESHYYVLNVRVYLDDIDRTNSAPLTLYFEGNITNQGYFITESITGYVITGDQSGFGVLYESFKNFLTDLFNGSSDQQTSADDFESAAQDQSDRLDYSDAEIKELAKPDLSGMNFEVNDMVDPNVLTLSTSGISTALSNNIFLKVLIMALTLALAGFILYGKK